jgi:hypothetical protein
MLKSSGCHSGLKIFSCNFWFMTLGCWHFEEISSLHFLGEVTDSILNSTGFWGTSEIL